MRSKRHAETHALKKAVDKNSAAGQAETHALKEAVEKNSAAGQVETHALKKECGDACA